MDGRSSTKESLTAGYFWTFGSTALPLVGSFVGSMVVARWMGPRAVGLINWTMALATIFLIAAKFGVEGAASKFVSEYRVSSPGYIGNIVLSSILLRLVFTLPVAVAATLFAAQLAEFFGERGLIPLFRISGLLIFSVSFNELAALLIIGMKRFRLLFAIRSAMLVLRIGLIFAAALLALGPLGVLGAYIAAALIPALAAFVIIFRLHPLGGEGIPDGADGGRVWKKLLRFSAPLAVSGASVTIYSLLDKLMLGYFKGASDVGLYSMARNLVETSLFPTFALVMTLRPAMAEAWAGGDKNRCSDLANRSLRDSITYSVLVVIVFGCLARPLITGLFTDSFAESARLLLLFLPLIVMRSLGSVILPGLIAANRAGTYAKLTLAGALLNFLLNIFLIPTFGAEGAVAATLISYLPIEVLGLRAVAVSFPGIWRRGDNARLLKIVAVGSVIAALHLFLVRDPGGILRTLIDASAMTIAFTTGLIVTGAYSRGEAMDLLRPVIGGGCRKKTGGKT